MTVTADPYSYHHYSVFIIVDLIFFILRKLNMFSRLVAILISLSVKFQFVFLAHICVWLFFTLIDYRVISVYISNIYVYIHTYVCV